ncbi:DUF3857 domain-containing protein [Aquimarina sp. RZ0]|uniref:DUF3857 domain-containing protein n=1 Tax=Aquimarina sp. RZ0 TaxID=2607730 RepID=UPI0011F30A8B|nr:DUF3857 domain-containing protein [Aquimarina sp. RZ0]KAA1247054.1 DUF3857 domain-containing protein [Aquimarina sp. RZ0]
MNKKLLIIFSALFFMTTQAQEIYNDKSMVVSRDDLKNSKYQKDTTANAFYIYEKGFSRVENGNKYNLLTDYERKIKILNPNGYNEATIEILLYKDKNRKEKIRKILAYTYNLKNNKIIRTKVKESDIYREQYDEHYTLVKFTFPDIKPGSVITYSYQKESPYIFKFNGWDFQDDIPKLYSEYISDLPGNYIYNIKLVGFLTLDTNESTLIKRCLEIANGASADCSHNVYIMKDIPAFEEEKYMTAKKNYFSRINYELKEYNGFDGKNKKYTETWKDVDKKFKSEKGIGLQLKKINSTKNILPDSILTTPNTLEKAKNIHSFISNTYTWNGKYKIFSDVTIKEVIDNKVGNVSGINILLHNTLKQQGFDVSPILVSTRENGYATKIYPIISDFNYIIIQLSLDGKKYLLDATEKLLPFGEVPYRCLNQYGRLMDFKKGSYWVDIKSSMKSFHYYNEDLKLSKENNSVTGKLEYVYSGHHGYTKRKRIQRTSQNAYLKKIKNLNDEIEVVDATLKNITKIEKPFIENFLIKKEYEETDNLLFINPFLNPFFKENPFKLSKRTYPVDFGYKDSYTYIVSIEIPENFEFLDIPENLNYQLPESTGKLSLGFQKQGNKLLINHRIIFTSSYYPPEFYDALKEFFNLIVDMENNTVITIKKTN